MIDTGCRKACGGRLWHESQRKELDARGIGYERQDALEYFQFGPGDPIASRSLWKYTVGIVGVVAQLAICELESESPAIDQVPGLIGPDELAEWKGNLFFTDGIPWLCILLKSELKIHSIIFICSTKIVSFP